MTTRSYLPQAMYFSRALILCGIFLNCILWDAVSAQDIDFVHEIAPIFKRNCVKCHGGDEREGELSLNSREDLLRGGEHGAAFSNKDAKRSLLIQLVSTDDKEKRMPPEGAPLTADEISKLSRWIEQGARWEPGFTFAKIVYEPPLHPRLPELPGVRDGRTNPIDRILDSTLTQQGTDRPQKISDSVFVRRIWMDLHGLLPPVDEYRAFMKDTSPSKRERLIDRLLQDNREYAEHWLTFWNDLFRNDYGGTGFITGGRKQISSWLYRSLIENKPYDQMARELIAPTSESSGFADGIRWRGTVSAGQTVEIQFAQSVGQSFLGINLKCASCHDSFIDRWTLGDAYGLAAIYSKTPLEIHRCDKLVGKQAEAKWLFPELGKITTTAPPQQRLQELAALMTHANNGRFSRTIVNRIWHQLMGRGIVEPVDAMQTQPWNEDLLDWLAYDFQDHKYNLKHVMKVICTSEAYQSATEIVEDSNDLGPYVYRGPRAKRMTAEQYVDCVWQLTGAAPKDYDAPFIRGDISQTEVNQSEINGRWIWNRSDSGAAPAEETVTFRKSLVLDETPIQAGGVVTCDNSFELFVNGKKVASGDDWERVQSFLLVKHLKKGKNEFILVCKNGGSAPNPAGVFFEVRWKESAGRLQNMGSDSSWECTNDKPDKNGKFKKEPEWRQAQTVASPEVWMNRLSSDIRRHLSMSLKSHEWMVRASLLKSDAFQRTLGRTNRDQIVTSRPNAWSTLEALDLNNAQVLDNYLSQGAKNLSTQSRTRESLFAVLFEQAFSRTPSPEELSIASQLLPEEKPTTDQVQDLLWSIVMLPEFQIIR